MMNEQNNNFNLNNGMNNSQPVVEPQQPVIENQEIHTKNSNKKIILIIIGAVIAVLVAVLLYIFVFSGKTLTCTVDEENMGIILSAKLEMKFKGNEVSNADIDMTFDLGDYVNYKDIMLEQIEEQYSDDEFKNMGVKVTSDDTKIYVNMEATKETFKDAGFSTEGTYKEVKKDLEDQGFTCK